MPHKYRKTVYACYAADMIQAIVINVTPILFVFLKASYGLSYSQFGTLVFVNFATQVIVDIAFSKIVDRYGYRPFVVGAHILCALGFVLFALTPLLLPGHEYAGFLLGTTIFAGAGGLFELLLSPIVDALPSTNKAKEMSLLHSMYAWGKLICILLTTIALFIGVPWYKILLLYALLPLINAIVFMKVPLLQKIKEAEIMPSKQLLLSPIFILSILAILMSGAAECTISQWSSTLMQDGLGLPKVWGDLVAVGGFSLMLAMGRLLHGLYASKLNLTKLLVAGSLLTAVSYILIAVSPLPWVGAAACAMAGLFISIAWPGTLSIASLRLPNAGTALFALLAAAGDMGGSIGPWAVGKLIDAQISLGVGSSFSLRCAAFAAAIFPLLAALFQWKIGFHTQSLQEKAKKK